MQMSFDWSHYLVVARELIGQRGGSSSQEARLRSAISRAYYAAFCKASNYLRDKEGLPVTNPRHQKLGHQEVIDVFKRKPDSPFRQVGADLDRLRGDRETADYHDHAPSLTSNQTTLDLILAESLIKTVDSLS